MTDTTGSASDYVQKLMLSWPSQETIFVFLALDVQGTIIWASPSVTDLFSYAPADLLGKNFEVLFTAEDRAKRIPEHELRVARHVGYSEDDRWHVRSDGTLLWANGVTTAVKRHDGTLQGFAKVTRDRTDLKTQLVTSQNRVIAHQQAEQLRCAFEQTLAHEQANALHAISAAAQVLSRSATAYPQAVAIIQRQVKALERLVEDLKAGCTTGQPIAHPLLSLQAVELQSVLTGVSNALRDDAAASGVDLQLLLPEAPIVLSADRDRLEQVVHNLLINAIKYTPAGGTIWVQATTEGEHAVVRVQDTGVGISGEMLPRIFDMFTQESRSMHLARGGSGIGLSVVKQWVDAHGGTVEVRSDGVGKGAEFTVRLPLR